MSADRRTVVVTGASAGLGYFAAEQLADAGHRVVLATRSATRAAAAERSIRRHVPDADLGHVHLDLAGAAQPRQHVATEVERVVAVEPLLRQDAGPAGGLGAEQGDGVVVELEPGEDLALGTGVADAASGRGVEAVIFATRWVRRG